MLAVRGGAEYAAEEAVCLFYVLMRLSIMLAGATLGGIIVAFIASLVLARIIVAA